MAASVLKRPAASGSGAPAANKRKQDAIPLSKYKAQVSLEALQREAEKAGFQAKDYLTNGFTVLQHPVLTDEEVALALGAAQRVRKTSKSINAGGEFVFLRGQSTDDRRRLFALLNKYLSLLHQLLGGIRLPGSDWAPYAHHNQVQVAIKRPGFEGYGRLDQMSSSLTGHIDQPAKKQLAGKAAANYSLLLGVVLSGDTASRSDAGNLFVAPRTHTMLAEAFRKKEGPVPWYADIVGQHLDPENPPRMKAVRAKPGQAILMHHQTVHGVGPNHSDEDRVNIYFRITSKGRPEGKLLSYPEAMQDPLRETPLLRELAEAQQQQGKG
ncbi:unnamed protein product [Polarella glacialis]|uniref:Phytanoyl-CoA dioxygenase n=1 Tax=Polarella glacialis TaxID=89957 RepID=A0A813IQ95_POLGL|nr:unnamed protein product [Polarella glacialis]CAE8653084.1 unnamed protein product [Polarella glacialis]